MKKLFRKVSTYLVIGMMGVTVAVTPPLYEVQASTWSNVFSSLLSGLDSYLAIDQYMDYINNTDEGRAMYFEKLQKEYGVSSNSYRASVLDTIMARLSKGVAAIDPSVNDKPYLYFLNPDEGFNAACGLGRVLTVNEGIFNLSDNIDEIAVVLGHEMGHGQKDHVVKGTRKKIRNVVGASVAASAMGNTYLSNAVLGVLVTQINNVHITKSAEWEADDLAFDYCYHAGYNPGATAALWQRVIDKKGEFENNLIGEIFMPNDHPTHHERRDHYEKRLSDLSKGHVTMKKHSDMVQINNQDFIVPAAFTAMSTAERKYFVMGNLAKAYAHGEDKKDAYVQNGTVMLGNQAIISPLKGDLSAEAIVRILNKIK